MQIQEHGVLASSLLLLADSHAARAEKGAIRQRWVLKKHLLAVFSII